MTTDEQAVRLVLLGDATSAPVCEGDACDLPAAATMPGPGENRDPLPGDTAALRADRQPGP